MTEIPLPEGLEGLSDEALDLFTDMAQVALLNAATSPEEKVKLGHTLKLLTVERDFRKELEEQDLIEDLTDIDDVEY
jgi:hypothetical protein